MTAEEIKQRLSILDNLIAFHKLSIERNEQTIKNCREKLWDHQREHDALVKLLAEPRAANYKGPI